MLQDMKVQIKQETILETMPVKKKRDRFKGMTEEEVLKRVLPDHLTLGLDIAIVSSFSAFSVIRTGPAVWPFPLS